MRVCVCFGFAILNKSLEPHQSSAVSCVGVFYTLIHPQFLVPVLASHRSRN